MVSFAKKSTDENLPHVSRLRELIEDKLEGAGFDAFNATVSVVELACMEPGCPPKETIISVLEKGRAPLKFTVLKPMAEVSDGEARTAGGGAAAPARTRTTAPRGARRPPPRPPPRRRRARRRRARRRRARRRRARRRRARARGRPRALDGRGRRCSRPRAAARRSSSTHRHLVRAVPADRAGVRRARREVPRAPLREGPPPPPVPPPARLSASRDDRAPVQRGRLLNGKGRRRRGPRGEEDCGVAKLPTFQVYGTAPSTTSARGRPCRRAVAHTAADARSRGRRDGAPRPRARVHRGEYPPS